jgi:hypothetical protein
MVPLRQEFEGREAEKRMEGMIELRREDWTGLHLDPVAGDLWKLSYPWSSSHGGGSPHLTAISAEEAFEEFGIGQEAIDREREEAKRVTDPREDEAPFGLDGIS